MATWNITPTTGVQDQGGGKYIFTAPDEGSIEYTIKYTDDDGTTAQTTYIVNAGDCVNCDCGKISFTGKTISRDGGSDIELGTFEITNNYCKKTYDVGVRATSNVTNPRVSGNKIYGTVSSNTGDTRNIGFKLLFNGNECQKYVTQTAGCLCSNNSYSYSISTSTLPASGGTVTLGTFSMNNGCSSSIISVESSNMTVNKDGNSFKATVSRNTGSTRTFSYSIKINGSVCNTYTVSQPTDCVCQISVTSITDVLSASGGCYVTLGRVQAGACLGTVTASTNVDWLTFSPSTIDISDGKVKGCIRQNGTSVAKRRTATITLSARASDGSTCSDDFTITQYAAMTDNDSAMQTPKNLCDCSIHPLHISGDGTGGGNDTTYTNNFEWSTSPFNEQSWPDIDGWKQGDCTQSAIDTSSIHKSGGHLIFNLFENPSTTNTRKAMLFLHNTNFTSSGDFHEFGWIALYQCPKGKKWVDTECVNV